MIVLKSPAKINLFLRILKRRSDGYHNLASLFQAISLYDTIHFSLSDKDTLTCTDCEIPTDSSNLISKAAHLFRSKTGLKFGLNAHLEKRIPHQAGLGGGSSNAATTLWALNELHNKPASLQDLIQWSGEIGSDIPFFFSQGTAYCTGRGEILHPQPNLPPQQVWIAKPKEGLATSSVFKALDLSKILLRDPQQTLQSFYQNNPQYYNDLEDTAFLIEPSLKIFKQKLLNAGFNTLTMSGSGSAFFCFGHPNKSSPDLNLHPAQFISRTADTWYQGYAPWNAAKG